MCEDIAEFVTSSGFYFMLKKLNTYVCGLRHDGNFKGKLVKIDTFSAGSYISKGGAHMKEENKGVYTFIFREPCGQHRVVCSSDILWVR
jgi:hypothetical protein